MAQETLTAPVGQREPCPCGSGKRYKQCCGKKKRAAKVQLNPRPFQGLPGECDWVALREIVPAAKGSVTTTDGTEIDVVTLLPMQWAGLHREDGLRMLGLQVTGGSGDISKDLGGALQAVVAAQAGNPVVSVPSNVDNLPIQELIDCDRPFTVSVLEGYDYWLAEEQLHDDEIRSGLDDANAGLIPTERLVSVDAAYWCKIGDRCHLRWVLPDEEEAALDAIARLHADGHSGLGEGTRYIGAFRAHGLLVPVWDLASESTADSVEDDAVAWRQRLDEALAVTQPLTAEQRRARAGLASRQLTLR